MGAMKNMRIEFIERIVSETGCDYDYVDALFENTLSRGVKPIDFFDQFVDEHYFR